MEAEAGDDGRVLLAHLLHQVPVFLYTSSKQRVREEMLLALRYRAEAGGGRDRAERTSEVPLTANRATPEAVAARMREGAAAAMRGSCRWQCASKSRTAEAARPGAWVMLLVGELRWPEPVRRPGWVGGRCPRAPYRRLDGHGPRGEASIAKRISVD